MSGDPQAVTAGASLDIPARTPHRIWNAGPGTATVDWTITPAMRSEQMFHSIARGVRGIRGLAFLIRYRHEFRIGRPRR